MAEKIDRPIPPWAAGVVSRLSRDRPWVVTRADLDRYLAEADVNRDSIQAARDLQRLGWLSSVHLKGVWAFVPAGEGSVTDPYLDLRAWEARDPEALFFLIGEAAAWHLGYVPRRHDGPVAVWLPSGQRVPHGLRAHVSVVRIPWSAEHLALLPPTTPLLHRKGLDLVSWASGLPAVGPEALLVQLASRPTSFHTWADLVGQLDLLAVDCDLERTTELLGGMSTSAWQRAGYLLDRGGQREAGVELLEARPRAAMSTVQLGNGSAAVWSNRFRVNDRLVAPLQQQLGKA
jgi:hypothetical protein